MLDENLPTFYLRPSADKLPHHGTFMQSVNAGTPEPAYAIHRPDPKSTASHNLYSIALLDAYIHDIVFAEVLMRPEWTQPTLSQEEIRRNGGVPPPPQPIPPTSFTIQLYNPEQQVKIEAKSKSWGSSEVFDFEMPVQTFRVPSLSTLDRSQNDPHVDASTPKLSFRWKRDSKLSKDMTLYFRTSQLGPDGRRRRSKEPDITVALFQHLKEVTIYEPNLTRVDIEDYKGMELVILLSAVAIRDLFFMKFEEVCNITTYAAATAAANAAAAVSPGVNYGVAGRVPNNYSAPAQNGVLPPSARPPPVSNGPRPPPADPLTQWQIDAETTRLQKEQEAERRRNSRKEKEERAKLKKMVEAEEKARKKREAEVAKETERLKKLYGDQGQYLPNGRPQVHFAPNTAPPAPSRPPPQQSYPQQGYAQPSYPQTSPWQRQNRPPQHGRRQSVPQSGHQQSSGWFNLSNLSFGHHNNASQPALSHGAIQRPPQQGSHLRPPQPDRHHGRHHNHHGRPSSPGRHSPSQNSQAAPKPNIYQQPLAAVSTLGNFLNGLRPHGTQNDGGRLQRKRSSIF